MIDAIKHTVEMRMTLTREHVEGDLRMVAVCEYGTRKTTGERTVTGAYPEAWQLESQHALVAHVLAAAFLESMRGES